MKLISSDSGPQYELERDDASAIFAAFYGLHDGRVPSVRVFGLLQCGKWSHTLHPKLTAPDLQIMGHRLVPLWGSDPSWIRRYYCRRGELEVIEERYLKDLKKGHIFNPEHFRCVLQRRVFKTWEECSDYTEAVINDAMQTINALVRRQDEIEQHQPETGTIIVTL